MKTIKKLVARFLSTQRKTLISKRKNHDVAIASDKIQTSKLSAYIESDTFEKERDSTCVTTKLINARSMNVVPQTIQLITLDDEECDRKAVKKRNSNKETETASSFSEGHNFKTVLIEKEGQTEMKENLSEQEPEIEIILENVLQDSEKFETETNFGDEVIWIKNKKVEFNTNSPTKLYSCSKAKYNQTPDVLILSDEDDSVEQDPVTTTKEYKFQEKLNTLADENHSVENSSYSDKIPEEHESEENAKILSGVEDIVKQKEQDPEINIGILPNENDCLNKSMEKGVKITEELRHEENVSKIADEVASIENSTNNLKDKCDCIENTETLPEENISNLTDELANTGDSTANFKDKCGCIENTGTLSDEDSDTDYILLDSVDYNELDLDISNEPCKYDECTRSLKNDSKLSPSFHVTFNGTSKDIYSFEDAASPEATRSDSPILNNNLCYILDEVSESDTLDSIAKGCSTDMYPTERSDIDDPNWEEYRRQKSEQAQYKKVIRIWNEKEKYNPKKNLTFSSFKIRTLERRDLNKRNRKRKASPIREPPCKLSKMYPGTFLQDLEASRLEEELKEKIQEIEREHEEKLKQVENAHFSLCAKIKYATFCQIQQTSNGQKRAQLEKKFMNHSNGMDNALAHHHRELNCQRDTRIKNICKTYQTKLSRVHMCQYEMETINSFYKINSCCKSDPTLLSENEMQYILQIEKAFDLCQSFYGEKRV